MISSVLKRAPAAAVRLPFSVRRPILDEFGSRLRDRGAAAADALGDIAPTRALPQLVLDSLVPAAIFRTPFILAGGLGLGSAFGGTTMAIQVVFARGSCQDIEQQVIDRAQDSAREFIRGRREAVRRWQVDCHDADLALDCYVEIGISQIVLRKVDRVYTGQEGPGGFCLTRIISTVDYAAQRYTSKTLHESNAGDICRAQKDETHIYTKDDFIRPMKELHCDGIESVPSLWLP